MRRRFALFASLSLALGLGCPRDPDPGAGVGSDRTGCGAPGSHSVPQGAHSCVCEAGYDWCSDALDDFDCCPLEDEGDESDESDGGAQPPDAACDEAALEALLCVEDPQLPGPADAVVWACNGEQWIEAKGYATFACLAEGFPFAYGCRAVDEGPPEFLCAFGPGSTCDPELFPSECTDEDIIDTCVWGRRTIDRCSRLCAELEAFGPGFATGACVSAKTPIDLDLPPESALEGCECE